MELSRRDAITALGAVGAGAGAAYAVRESEDSSPGESDPDVETLTAVAEVVYPDEVTGLESFVEAYARRRAAADDDHAREVRRAVAELNDRAEAWYSAPFAALSADDRDSLLREVGADTAEEDPAGTTAERVRY